MEQHWKLKDLGLTIVFSVIYAVTGIGTAKAKEN